MTGSYSYVFSFLLIATILSIFLTMTFYHLLNLVLTFIDFVYSILRIFDEVCYLHLKVMYRNVK